MISLRSGLTLCCIKVDGNIIIKLFQLCTTMVWFPCMVIIVSVHTVPKVNTIGEPVLMPCRDVIFTQPIKQYIITSLFVDVL